MTVATWLRPIAFAFAALMFLAIPALAADPTFPDLNGRRVVDEAHILSASDQAAITAKLAALEAANTDQFVVVTVPSLQGDEIEDYSYKLGRKWGIGQKGANNGILLIVVPAEHKVRIEVGYGLEDVMTDAMASLILSRDVLPKFKAHDYPGGVNAGVDSIIHQLSLEKGEAIAKAKAEVKAAEHHNNGWVWFAPFLIPGLTMLFFLLHWLTPRRYQPYWFATGFQSSGGGGWSSGGGGGFSGGGGSFGGGGASGSW